MVQITYIGHSTLLIRDSVELLIDPYLSGKGWFEGLSRYNPKATRSVNDVDPDSILLTHGHADHFGQTFELLERTDTTLIASPTVCEFVERQTSSERLVPINIFQELSIDTITVRAVPAVHKHGFEGVAGNLLGMLVYRRYLPCGTNMGYLLSIDDKTIYHSGDTCGTTGVNAPDIAFLGMDGDRTMNAEEALEMIEQISPKTIVPIHYRWNMEGRGVVEEVKRSVPEGRFRELEYGETIRV